MASGKTVVLITGGNTGLGLEIVKALYTSDRAYDIVIGSRNVQRGEDAIASVKQETPDSKSSLSLVQVDISSDESITAARDQVASQFGHLDVLVNNAGANHDAEFDGKLGSRQGWLKSWDTNVAGNMVMTNEFMPLLVRSTDPRLLFIASGTSSLADTLRMDHAGFVAINSGPEAGWPKPRAPFSAVMYRTVKTGLNMAMREWSRILSKDGVKVWGVSPGFLATGLAGVGPEKLKQDVVEGKRDEDVGRVIRKDGIQPW
ncbi:hypothetical protein CKM354_000449200 [Cercospora kikuchii]|uniref:NAD(P)-binding protein n=1 Tax=Cercospora kikuchii TaxID=84275 RepID=A0A9P3FEN5_9PEZI|nr:uncharacterized protein CKM354_000449200 [Cercospora kikuchii]GIZ41177.1 hypothetical protein CKM354_000449200 [Cercospora kikuchii]